MRTEARGVTLLELVMSLAVVAILATIAVPGFNALRHGSERATAVNSFVHAVFLARSEAIKRGQVVTICKSVDGQTCASRAAEWRSGWIVFVNGDRDDPPQRDPGEPLLWTYAGWPRGHIVSNREAYSFRAYAQAGVNGTVVFCDPRGSAQARAVIISQTGRPRVARRDASNKPLRCPAEQ